MIESVQRVPPQIQRNGGAFHLGAFGADDVVGAATYDVRYAVAEGEPAEGDWSEEAPNFKDVSSNTVWCAVCDPHGNPVRQQNKKLKSSL